MKHPMRKQMNGRFATINCGLFRVKEPRPSETRFRRKKSALPLSIVAPVGNESQTKNTSETYMLENPKPDKKEKNSIHD